jgi:hydroxypyruvate reductase
MNRSPTQDLLRIFHAALEAVMGDYAVAQRLANRPIAGPVALVAVGKAAQAMARGARQVLTGQIGRGLVISKPGHLDTEYCKACGWEAIEGGHPLPDAGSLLAGQRLLDLLSQVDQEEKLLFLISGGASSLLEVPAAGVDLAFLRRANDWLLASGLAIQQMNLVRKGLSRVKAGGLLGWLSDRSVRALAISDVPGDDPAVIGSGLLTPDPALAQDLGELELPDWLSVPLRQAMSERPVIETPGPEVEIVANLEMAKTAAARQARESGYPVRQVDAFVAGDATETGRRLAKQLIEDEPGVTIWGGETTVTLPLHPGRGGRNQQLALAAAQVLAGHEDCWLLSAGSDGSDGPTQDAGALVDGGTLERAILEGYDADLALQTADAGSLLEASGDLIHTGPTDTNVMDLMIGLKV